MGGTCDIGSKVVWSPEMTRDVTYGRPALRRITTIQPVTPWPRAPKCRLSAVVRNCGSWLRRTFPSRCADSPLCPHLFCPHPHNINSLRPGGVSASPSGRREPPGPSASVCVCVFVSSLRITSPPVPLFPRAGRGRDGAGARAAPLLSKASGRPPHSRSDTPGGPVGPVTGPEHTLSDASPWPPSSEGKGKSHEVPRRRETTRRFGDLLCAATCPNGL